MILDMAKTTVRKTGRPLVGNEAMLTTLPVRVSMALVNEIDDECEKYELASVKRSQMIRTLLQEALRARRGGRK